MPRWFRRLFPCLFHRRRSPSATVIHALTPTPAPPPLTVESLPAPLRRAIFQASGFDFAKAKPHLPGKET
jgi:hypothetical protein